MKLSRVPTHQNRQEILHAIDQRLNTSVLSNEVLLHLRQRVETGTATPQDLRTLRGLLGTQARTVAVTLAPSRVDLHLWAYTAMCCCVGLSAGMLLAPH